MTTTTTAPTGALEALAPVRALRVALIAPPTASVPPASLGGLDQVRWLAQGLAERGHQVTLIGAGLGELATGGYAVIDTDPTGGQRASAEIVERLHAEQAGKVLEQLGSVDVVSDHTRTGWLPPDPQRLDARTVQTSYRPLAGLWEPAPRVAGHLGWVAVSEHQQRNAPGMPWAGVIHPAIPVGEHVLSFEHAGPCVYLGPLLDSHGAGLALAAAHTAGRSIVLAGTQPGARATAYTEVELRPRLASGDELLESVSLLERWDLLADASCLVAPLHPGVPFSLEVVEAMAYGTPVVTLVGTVGAELVSHGVSGLVISDAVLLPGAIGKTEPLDPRRVRAHAASRFDLRGMVSAYEWLFTQLVSAGGR
jgi:glycosyltransferase involved in cell wall biosynthesis